MKTIENSLIIIHICTLPACIFMYMYNNFKWLLMSFLQRSGNKQHPRRCHLRSSVEGSWSATLTWFSHSRCTWVACTTPLLDDGVWTLTSSLQVLHLEQLLTTGGGWQDQCGGLYGGVKISRSDKGLPVKILTKQLELSKEIFDQMNEHLILVYTGKTRLARNLLQVYKYKTQSHHSFLCCTPYYSDGCCVMWLVGCAEELAL